MSLPKQVQAELEAAERIEQELQNAANPQPEPVADEPETEPVVEPEPVLEQEPEPQPEPTKHSDDETWERRYKTLQGMFNAETARNKAEVADLKSQLKQVLSEIKESKAAPTEPQRSLVTDKDVEDFGGDLVDLIGRKAADVVNAEMSRLKAENAQLREEMGSVSEQQGEARRDVYFSNLERLVPDYKELNVDTDFLEWLAEVDTMSGQPRQNFLNNAFESYDVDRTAVLFNAFKELTAVPAKPKVVPKELQRQVAPGTSKASSVASTPANERVWKMSEIDRFYKDVARGNYKGNDAEQARIEAEIDQAVLEGRLSQ
jgi:hypothetical protein